MKKQIKRKSIVYVLSYTILKVGIDEIGGVYRSRKKAERDMVSEQKQMKNRFYRIQHFWLR